MPESSRFSENLPGLAAEASTIAPRLCGPCRNYHFLWPYLRLAGAPGTVDTGKHHLRQMISDALSPGKKRVLIAGCADTGLFALVAEAASDAEIVALDRCETPLELCRRYAERRDLSIRTLRLDLENLAEPSSYDLVLAHSILPFISAERRLRVLTQLRRCLHVDGKLVLRFRTRGPSDSADLAAYRSFVPDHLLERLDLMGVPLPEPRQVFLERLDSYARERHARDVEVSLADVEQLLEAAGFAIASLTQLPSQGPAPFQHIAASASKRRLLAVAVPI